MKKLNQMKNDIEITRPMALQRPEGAGIAVVILNWNGRRLLEEFLPSVVAASSPRACVAVADNGSTDDSVEWLRSRYPQVPLLLFPENYGFAEGYNRVVAIASAAGFPYVLLLNSDVAVTPGWTDRLYDFMQTHPEVGACQPKILSYKDKTRFEYAGASGGFIDRNGYPYCRGRIFDTCESDRGQYDDPIMVDWASGAALLVRTELYLKAGGLDSSFFAHMEEIDLCWRIRRMGYRIAVVPSSVVYHLGGGSLPPSDPRKTYLNFRNNLLMLYKNLPGRGRTRRLIWRRILDTAAWGRFIVSGQWGSAAAIVRAHRDFSRMARGITPRPAAEGDGESLSGRPDILVSYYLRGLKRFSDLPR